MLSVIKKNIPESNSDSSRFLKSVAALVSGTALSQIISFSFIPVITRLYGPEAYGGLGYYSSLISFIIPFVGLCYPLAIVLPKSEREAAGIAELSIKISFSIIFIVFILLLVNTNLTLVSTPFSHSVFFIVSGVATSFLVIVLTQFCIRNKEFKKLSVVLVIVAMTGGVAKVVSGYFIPTSEILISVTISAGILQCILLSQVVGYGVLRSLSFSVNRRDFALFKRFKRFPIYRLPHTIVATLSQLMPVFLLTAFFGVKYAGYFVLTRAALGTPVALVGKAIYDVAYPTINQRKIQNKPNYNFVSKLTVGLMVLSLFPLATFIFYGEGLFAFVFGEEWSVSGKYASWMAVWFAFNLFNKACAASVSVYHLDSFLFYNGILNLSLCSMGFLIGYYFYQSDIKAIAMFSLFGVFCQLFLIGKVLSLVKKSDNKIHGCL